MTVSLARAALAALAVFAGTATLAAPAFAQADPVYTGTFSNTAVQGYDAVAYFTEGAPVEGSKAFSTEYQGAEFRFSSQANLDAFLGDPARYAPQYGGYCAYAAAMGQRAKGDAKQWHIHEGKLYLNVNRSIRERWLGDKENLIEKADANWPGLLD